MFGYIKPLQRELRVGELDCYKAVYCGLCRRLSSVYGPFARFTLSYDFTFAAMLYAGVSGEKPVFEPRRCPYNPIKKRPHLLECPSLDFCADVAMIMLYYKCEDNVSDSSLAASLPWRAAAPLTGIAAKKAASRLPKAMEAVGGAMKRQKEIEEDPQSTLDMACDPTAESLGRLFEMMSEDVNARRVLYRLGYMLGRYVYLCDAIDDLESDRSHGGFNPFLRDDSPERMKGLLNLTIAELCRAYDLLDITVYKEILDNILYLGLADCADRLLSGRCHDERSV